MDSPDTLVREMVRKQHQRRRTRLASLLAAVVILAAMVVGAGAVRANKSAPGTAPSHVPAGGAIDVAGLVVATGAVQIDFYLDYLCPECRNTNRAIATELNTLKASRRVRLVYHPVTFLDDYSRPSGYSTRASSAAACAAEQGKFEQYSTVLFDKQPAEQGPGLNAAELVAAGRDTGITAGSFTNCVNAGTYVPWAKYVSEVAASRDIASTPTVMVNGRSIDITGSDPGAALARAVTEAER
jgi:protein-disulfide isomerase